MFFEKTSENFDFLLTSEILVFKLINNSMNIKARIKAIIISEVSKPVKERRIAPVRKPNPLTAFLDPVIRETHLNNFEFLLGESSLTELLALIFVKSLAIPDKPCVNITKITDKVVLHV